MRRPPEKQGSILPIVALPGRKVCYTEKGRAPHGSRNTELRRAAKRGRRPFAFRFRKGRALSRAGQERHTFHRCTKTRDALQRRKRKRAVEEQESLPAGDDRT